jgi:hypothetical protein
VPAGGAVLPSARHHVGLQFGTGGKLQAARTQVALAQQAAGINRETGEKEILDQRQARVRRRQQMAAGHPFLRAQVVEIDPDRARRQMRHVFDEGFRKMAGKAFHDNPRGDDRGETGLPAVNLDPLKNLDRQPWVQFRAQQPKAVEVIDPEANMQRKIARQLSRQAPADADIAEVVDDPAEHIPVGTGGKGGYGRHGRA